MRKIFFFIPQGKCGYRRYYVVYYTNVKLSMKFSATDHTHVVLSSKILDAMGYTIIADIPRKVGVGEFYKEVKKTTTKIDPRIGCAFFFLFLMLFIFRMLFDKIFLTFKSLSFTDVPIEFRE